VRQTATGDAEQPTGKERIRPLRAFVRQFGREIVGDSARAPQMPTSVGPNEPLVLPRPMTGVLLVLGLPSRGDGRG